MLHQQRAIISAHQFIFVVILQNNVGMIRKLPKPGPEVTKPFFMLNSTVHKISTAYKN